MTQAEELKSLVGTQAQRNALLEEVSAVVPPDCYERLSRLVELTGWLLSLLESKNLSLAKLRQLCFGAQTESARNLGGSCPKDPKEGKPKGHGRNGHRAYTGARRVRVSHPTARPGQTCPACRKGKLRPRKQPAVAVQVQAQPPVGATVYEMEQLRCDTCGRLFTAPTPPEAGAEKYALSVGVMVGLMRYGSGMPFYRLERLQRSLGVPLPSSVQWEQVERVARPLEPVFDHLIYLAAQSSLVCNDDTTMRVGALRKEIQAEINPKRTGIFTSAILGQVQSHRVALLFTGRAHAGENLAQVLAHRDRQRAAPLHMCDGLGQNTPKGHPTVGCNCNVHARRNFVDIRSYFPEECRHVVESLGQIYRLEAQAQARGLDPQGRLELHQTHSQPVMDQLKAWLDQQIQDRKVEPNSVLGQAIDYMRVRWEPLTQFLRVPGAPLDNNATERVLKMAILHRKNSLFYRTQRGAQVGDLFMSLVQTCRANGVNPFDYMLAVATHPELAKANPGRWLPWNFTDSLPDTG